MQKLKTLEPGAGKKETYRVAEIRECLNSSVRTIQIIEVKQSMGIFRQFTYTYYLALPQT